jgi:hypothetical protein
MAPKDEELRPVMTRIPERLRRRLEREARFRRRSMNAEIVHRLQESFDIPDQAEAIVQDIGSELDGSFGEVQGSLNEVKSQISAILAHLGLPDPVEEARARWDEAVRKANQPEALEKALRAIERAGFKISRLTETGPSAAPETKDEEKK